MQEKLYPIICDDLIKNFEDCFIELTVKTLWYILREQLLSRRRYDEELVKTLFSPEHSVIADFRPGSENIHLFLENISEMLSVQSDDIPYVYIDQLDLIFDLAVKMRMIKRNPLTPFLTTYTQRTTKRQMEIRQALVKKFLTNNEEKRILHFLFENITMNGSTDCRVVLQSIF